MGRRLAAQIKPAWQTFSDEGVLGLLRRLVADRDVVTHTKMDSLPEQADDDKAGAPSCETSEHAPRVKTQ